ncbi:ATP synthase subunit I [Thermodesulfitimonas autotrophica]|uniref:ATP synthase subunit I n=1 Tax=Thermodesulfitimonas autotrophica TaxID=1894989 RepID=UPI002FE30C5C
MLACAVLPVAAPWRSELVGFVVGASLSMINNWLLANSIQKLVAFVLRQGREFGQVLYITGMIVRWFLIFGVLVYIAWTGWCGLLGLLAGYFIPPLLVLARLIHFLLFARVDYS